MLVKGTEISGGSGTTKKKKVVTPVVVPNILANPSLANAPVAPTPVPIPVPTPIVAPNILANPSLANAPIVAHDSGAGVTPVATTPNILANPSLANAPAASVASPALPNATDLRYDTPWAKQIATDAIARQEAARLLPNGFLATGVNPYGSTDGAGAGGAIGGTGGGSGGTAGGASPDTVNYGADGLGSSVVAPAVPNAPASPVIASPLTNAPTGSATAINPSTAIPQVTQEQNAVVAPIPVPEQNKYFDDVVSMKFDYNPATDQGYKQAAAQAENSIIQSIIGRGGLYSSVAQSAVATKLSDLSVTYQEAAYKKYTDERAYKMQLSQMEQERINTKWEQEFRVTQYQSDQAQRKIDNTMNAAKFEQDKSNTAWDQGFKTNQYQTDLAQKAWDNEFNASQSKFENEMNLAQFQFTQEKEAFDRSMTIAAAQSAASASYASSQSSSAKASIAAQEGSLQKQLLDIQTKKTQLKSYKNQWITSGTASREVAAFFAPYGVYEGASISGFQDVISGMENNLDTRVADLSNQAQTVADMKIMSQFMDDYQASNKVGSVAEKAGSSADTSTDAQSSFYYQTLNQLTGKGETAATTAKLITSLTSGAYGGYKTKMGSYYFGQLLNSLNSQKAALQKSEAAAKSGTSSNSGYFNT